MEPKKLYRSRKNHVIAGVCGGLGEYFNVDPVAIRVLAVILSLGGGPGILAYVVLWIVIPWSPDDVVSAPPSEPNA